MPEASLTKILNMKDVVEVLKDPKFEIPDHKRYSTAQVIVEEGKKVFAIAVEVGCEAHLSSFIEHSYLDASLITQLPMSLKIILQSYAVLFERIKSDYLVYTFRRGAWRKRIEDWMTLPYVRQERIGSGGFSTVYRVSIHHSQQSLIPETHDEVSEELISPTELMSYAVRNTCAKRIAPLSARRQS
jgi:hypothetical protein